MLSTELLVYVIVTPYPRKRYGVENKKLEKFFRNVGGLLVLDAQMLDQGTNGLIGGEIARVKNFAPIVVTGFTEIFRPIHHLFIREVRMTTRS